MDLKIGEDASWGSLDVQEGQEVDLSCTTTEDITACVFINPSGDLLYRIKNTNYEEGRITFDGKNSQAVCKIKIEAAKNKDNGEWK